MKPKTFFILVAAVSVLALSVYYISNEDVSQKSTMGGALFKDLPVNDVTAITIKSSEGTVNLEKGKKVWRVLEKSSYPADFNEITDLVRKVKDIKIGRVFTADGEILARQTLKLPGEENASKEEMGIRITLKGADKRVVADFVAGKERDTGAGYGGGYLMKPGDVSVYIVDKSFTYTDKKPEDWLDTKLLDVDPIDIKTVSVKAGESVVYSLNRGKPGADPVLADRNDKEQLDPENVKKVFKALSSLTVNDVAGKAESFDEKAFENAKEMLFAHNNGTQYMVSLGSKANAEGDSYYCKIKVGYKKEAQPSADEKTAVEDKPAIAEAKPVETDKAEAEVKADKDKADKDKEAEAKASESEVEDYAKVAAELDEKLNPWVFVLSKWDYDGFIAQRDGLMKKEEEQKE